MRLFLFLTISIASITTFANEDSERNLTCRRLTQTAEILKCTDGKYYAPTGEIISYQDNKDIMDSKRDSKPRITEGYYQQHESTSSSMGKSK